MNNGIRHVFKMPKFLDISQDRCDCGGLIVNGKCGNCEITKILSQEDSKRRHVWYEIENREAGKKRQNNGEGPSEDNRSKQYKD